MVFSGAYIMTLIFFLGGDAGPKVITENYDSYEACMLAGKVIGSKETIHFYCTPVSAYSSKTHPEVK